MTNAMDSVVIITIPKKSNLQLLATINYRTTSLFSYPNKVMLKSSCTGLILKPFRYSLENGLGSESELAPLESYISVSLADSVPCLHQSAACLLLRKNIIYNPELKDRKKTVQGIK